MLVFNMLVESVKKVALKLTFLRFFEGASVISRWLIQLKHIIQIQYRNFMPSFYIAMKFMNTIVTRTSLV